MSPLSTSAHSRSRLRRSVLSVPAGNVRALEKAGSLDCDAIIFDLEDSVALEMKAEARGNLRRLFGQAPLAQETIIRINPLASEFGQADMALVLELSPNAVLLPKVERISEIQAVADILSESGASDGFRIWAMIETPRGILNAAALPEADERLDCFVVGLNDLRKDTGVLPQIGRAYLVPWLMQVVLAAKAHGLTVIDSVFNDFRDADNFDAECAQGRAMGFDGKMLIHPGQIEASNRHFGPMPDAIAEAENIVAAFAKPAAQGQNVITMDGKMVERLHLEQAEKLLYQAGLIADRKRENP